VIVSTLGAAGTTGATGSSTVAVVLRFCADLVAL
jgi:hypothetical protein